MIKTIWVYAHLLCFAFAFGLIVRSDWQLFRQRHQALSADIIKHLAELAHLVSLCLAGLWISGIALLVIGYSDDGMHYLMNQKLWVKGVVVIAMTINGWALHTLGLPKLKPGVCISRLPSAEKGRLLLLGGLSAASWMYASFLGVARVLNHKASFQSCLCGYLAVIGGCLLVSWITHRPGKLAAA
jgi:hypothetical protein